MYRFGPSFQRNSSNSEGRIGNAERGRREALSHAGVRRRAGGLSDGGLTLRGSREAIRLGVMSSGQSEWNEAFFGPLFSDAGGGEDQLEPFLGGWIFSDDQGALAFRLTREYFERLDERSEPERFGYDIVRSAPGLIHIRLSGENGEIDEEQILELRDGLLRCFDEEGNRLEAFQRISAHGPYQPKELQIDDSPLFESLPDQAQRMRAIHDQHEERMRQYVDRLLAEGG